MPTHRISATAVAVLVLAFGALAPGCDSAEPSCEGAECVVVDDLLRPGDDGEPIPTRTECEAACQSLDGTCTLIADDDTTTDQINCVRACQDGRFDYDQVLCLAELPCGEDIEQCL